MKQLVLGLALTSILFVPPLLQARFSVPSAPSLRLRGTVKVERGIASWYGKERQGRRTASGDVYDMNKLTAAHPNLPFGSMVRVTNLKNRKSAIVRVNDRGPSVPGRIIDLSREAARMLGFEHAGLAEVSVEVVRPLSNSGRSEPEGPLSTSMPSRQAIERLPPKVVLTQEKLRIPSASSMGQVSAKEIAEAPVQLSDLNQSTLLGNPQLSEYDFESGVERKLEGAVLFLFHRAWPSPAYVFQFNPSEQ